MKYPHLKELLLACNSSDLVESIWDDCVDFQFISIDCEMIVTTVDPKCLARIGATKAEEVILHEFVKPRGVVKDYLHSITGLNEELLKKAQFTHPQVRQKVLDFLSPTTIWVGHDCPHDFRTLGIAQNEILVLDTCRIFRYHGFKEYVPALGDLSYIFLGVSIHEKGFAHDPVIDALATWHLCEFALKEGFQEIEPPRFVLQKWGQAPPGAVYALQDIPNTASWVDIETACKPLGKVEHVKLQNQSAEVEFKKELPKGTHAVIIKGKILSLLAISLPRNRKRKREESQLFEQIRKRYKVPSTPELEAMLAKKKIFMLDLDLQDDSEFQITNDSSDEDESD